MKLDINRIKLHSYVGYKLSKLKVFGYCDVSLFEIRA